MKATLAIVLGTLFVILVPFQLFSSAVRAPEVKIGSKAFTESVILGDIVSLIVRNAGAIPVQRRELGGTRVLWNALLNGEIDIYPEYTGTISEEILAQKGIHGGGNSSGPGGAWDHDDAFTGV